MKKASSQAVPSPPKKKPVVPKSPPWLAPNMRAKPNIQKSAEDSRKSTKFLKATLMLFLERTKPLSRQQKPACMSMTKAAHSRTQAMSSGVCVMFASGALGRRRARRRDL